MSFIFLSIFALKFGFERANPMSKYESTKATPKFVGLKY